MCSLGFFAVRLECEQEKSLQAVQDPGGYYLVRASSIVCARDSYFRTPEAGTPFNPAGLQECDQCFS